MALLPVDTQKWLPWKEAVTVTSVRTNSASVAEPVADAGAYRLTLKEAAASNGVYQAGDVRFTVATDAVTFAPKPRDTVLWNGNTFTVLDATGSDWTKHWVLTGRNLVLAADLRGTGTLSRPTTAQDAAGRPALTSYTTVAADVPCRVQPTGGSADDVGEKRTMPLRYTAFLAQQVDARAKDRFVSNGVSFTVLESHDPERIDELPSLTLERIGP